MVCGDGFGDLDDSAKWAFGAQACVREEGGIGAEGIDARLGDEG